MALLCREEGRMILEIDILGEERLGSDTGTRLGSDVGVILAVGVEQEATQPGNKEGCMGRRTPD
jgi:hypothetical protein